MNIKETIFIMSAESKNVNSRVNFYNHEELISRLESYKIPFKEVIGVYNGTSERSVLIQGLNNELLIKSLCNDYRQECYLVSGADRSSFLVFNNGTESYIGILIPVTQDEAIKNESYTLDPYTETYYITRKDK